MNFGDALGYLKDGLRMTREGWNGKDQYIEIASRISYVNSLSQVVNVEHEDIGSKCIAFVGTRGIQLGWLASQADMLATDWKPYRNYDMK